MEEIGDSLSGKILKVTTIEDMPLSGTETINGTVRGVGMVFEMLELLEETLNFSHIVVPSTDPVETVFQGKADFISAFLPIPRQPDGLSYSTPLSVAKWVLLMPRPSKSLFGSGLLAPFTLEVWMLTLSTLVIMGPLFFSIIKLRHKLVRPSAAKSRLYRLGECVWFTYGAIMKQGSPLDPSDDTTRLLFATWWIFITILTSYYTANLTAFLTLSRFTLPISHPEELAEKSIKWFGKSDGALEQAITGEDDEMSYLKDSLENGHGQLLECSNQQIIDLVLQDHVYLGELRKIQALVFESYKENFDKYEDAVSRCQMVSTTEPFLSRPTALAFQENSSLPQIFNPVLRSMVESGVVRHILNSKKPDSEVCPLHLGNSEKQLKLSDFTSTCLAVVFGFSLALLAFLFEKMLSKFFEWKSKTKVASNTSRKVFYPKEFLQIKQSNTPACIDPKLFIIHKAVGKSRFQIKQSLAVQFQYLE
ncbi:ionotropic receptor 93a [Neocloeon triangulifer]|uniref:ionotropic receptor 93a n=1 Tax=Neocloeon triangulifer TaxID=2078957 RepID=UPI00286F1F31|nr:ionotropic receptor 93a [Neocloeon triangulifer]